MAFTSPGGYQKNSWQSYLLYNYVHFNSCGFPNCNYPDVDAWAQPSIRGYGWGVVQCYFWESWSGAQYFPNLHTGYYCYDW